MASATALPGGNAWVAINWSGEHISYVLNTWMVFVIGTIPGFCLIFFIPSTNCCLFTLSAKLTKLSEVFPLP
jgi:hypothetical protein